MRERLDEQYRRAALSLAAAVREGRFCSVVFCSSFRKEGTTSTVLNVARHLKDSCGLNPLIVELNRRRPALTKLCRLEADKSVASIAAGAKGVQESIQKSAQGLAMIPVGDFRSLNSSGNLGLVEAVRRVLEELEGPYDVILWDAPPILEAPDAIALREMVPHMVLVMESGRSRYEVVERIRKELAVNGISIVGTVLVKQRRPIPGWIYRWLVQ
jgi:protein-tyrosine kinase